MSKETVTTYDPDKYYCVRCGKEWPDGQEDCDHYGRDFVKERSAAIDELEKVAREEGIIK